MHGALSEDIRCGALAGPWDFLCLQRFGLSDPEPRWSFFAAVRGLVPSLGGLLSVAVSAPAVEERAAQGGSLEELMGRYAGGEADAFEALFRSISPRLFRYLVRLTRRPDRAEDLVQVTFTKLHRGRGGYLQGAPVLPWVFAIARRAFLDDARQRRSRHEELSLDGHLPEPAERPLAPDHHLAEALEAALQKLPEAYAEVIQLLKFGGLTIRETAEVLGTSESAVKLRAHRAYAFLRSELEPSLKRQSGGNHES